MKLGNWRSWRGERGTSWLGGKRLAISLEMPHPGTLNPPKDRAFPNQTLLPASSSFPKAFPSMIHFQTDCLVSSTSLLVTSITKHRRRPREPPFHTIPHARCNIPLRPGTRSRIVHIPHSALILNHNNIICSLLQQIPPPTLCLQWSNPDIARWHRLIKRPMKPKM